MSRQVSCGSAGEYQADERAGVARLLLASIRQMTGQVSRGSAGEYQADERAGVAGKPGIKPLSPALADEFLTTGPPGKSWMKSVFPA